MPGVRQRVSALGLLVLAIVAVMAACPVTAQVTRVTPTLSGRFTWTNNYDLQSEANRESDFITTITPGISVDYGGPRSYLRGYVRVPLVIYAKHSSENTARPTAALNGHFEAIKDFFFVDAEASVTQEYFSPFGAQPDNIESVTENRYTSQTYRITPYIQGNIGSNVSYLLRDSNVWRVNSNRSSGTGGSLVNSYVNDLFGTINRVPTPLGWGADVNRTEYRYSGRGSQLMELARLRGVWQADPQLQLFVSGGYERNRFSLLENSNAVYGGGFRWRPTERTTLDARAEERFFGTSYDILFEHRTSRAVWSLQARRNTSDRPEYLGQLPAGVSVPGLLNVVLANRITDPVERARFIAEYMDDRGLPLVLDAPLDLYDPQIDVRETLIASLVLLGVRNTVLLSVYRATTEEIETAGIDIPPITGPRNNNTQTGVRAVWSNQLAPRTSMALSAGFRRTESETRFGVRSESTDVRWTVSHTVSPRTSVFGGARWQESDSTQQISDYTEAAVFVGFNHSFR